MSKFKLPGGAKNVIPDVRESEAKAFEDGGIAAGSRKTKSVDPRKRYVPADSGERLTEQLMIRMTPVEKQRIQDCFEGSGFRYINGFLRDLLVQGIERLEREGARKGG